MVNYEQKGNEFRVMWIIKVKCWSYELELVGVFGSNSWEILDQSTWQMFFEDMSGQKNTQPIFGLSQRIRH